MSELIRKEFIPNSTFISKIEYSYINNPKCKTCERLNVLFKDNRHHEYSPPIKFEQIFDMEKLYNDFISSESVGKFWHKNIKDKFEYKKIR